MKKSIKSKSMKKMDSVRLKNNRRVSDQKSTCQLAEEIFAMLNQGSLYNIHQVLEKLKNDDELKCLEKTFIEKFEFSFTKYI